MTILFVILVLPLLIAGLGVLADRLADRCRRHPRAPWGGEADRDLERVLHDLPLGSRC